MFENNSYSGYNINQVSFSASLKGFLKSKSLINRIIIVFIICFLAFQFVRLYQYLFAIELTLPEAERTQYFLIKFVSLGNSFESFIQYPWTLLTHIFVFPTLNEFIFYSITFYLLGKLFLSFWTVRRFLAISIISSLLGAFIFVISFKVFTNITQQEIAFFNGPGGALISLLFFVFVNIPQYQLYRLKRLTVKYWYFLVLVVLLDIYMNRETHILITHAGCGIFGAALGLFSTVKFPSLNLRMKYSSVKTETHRTHAKDMTDEEYNLTRKIHQEQIDKILEKISQSGYENLTKEEKELLFKESKR